MAQPDMDARGLASAEDGMLDAWARGDADELAGCFARHGVMVNVARPPAIGSHKIRSRLREVMGTGIEVRPRRVAAGMHGTDLGWTLVAYRSTLPDGTSHGGQYLATWRRDGDAWRIVSYASMPT